MKKNLFVTEGTPGLDYVCTVIELDADVCSEQELKNLARKVAKEYALTDEGRRDYRFNCGNFNWQDFADAIGNKCFAEICRKRGLSARYVCSADISEDLGEQLMEDISVDLVEIEWDTDIPAEELGLPREVTLDLSSPEDDIGTILYDEYGYCAKSYEIKGAF